MKKLSKLRPRRRALNVASFNQRAFFNQVLFEVFLLANSNNGESGKEFRLVISNRHPDGTLEFYCHPLGRDGSTFDGYVMGTEVLPKKAIDNLMKYMKETPLK